MTSHSIRLPLRTSHIISPDSNLIASYHQESRIIEIWKLQTRILVYNTTRSGTIFHLVFSPNSLLLAIADENGFEVVDINQNKTILKNSINNKSKLPRITELIFDSTSKTIFINNLIDIQKWNLINGSLEYSFALVTCLRSTYLAISHDNQMFVVDYNDYVEIRNFGDGKLMTVLGNKNGTTSSCIQFFPDNNKIIRANYDSKIEIWSRSHSGCELVQAFEKKFGYVKSIVFSQNGNFFALISNHHVVILNSHDYQVVRDVHCTNLIIDFIFTIDERILTIERHDDIHYLATYYLNNEINDLIEEPAKLSKMSNESPSLPEPLCTKIPVFEDKSNKLIKCIHDKYKATCKACLLKIQCDAKFKPLIKGKYTLRSRTKIAAKKSLEEKINPKTTTRKTIRKTIRKTTNNKTSKLGNSKQSNNNKTTTKKTNSKNNDKKCGPCEHKPNKYNCFDCYDAGTGGAGICEHHRRKYRCRDCYNNGITNSEFCQHLRRKYQCADCNNNASDSDNASDNDNSSDNDNNNASDDNSSDNNNASDNDNNASDASDSDNDTYYYAELCRHYKVINECAICQKESKILGYNVYII